VHSRSTVEFHERDGGVADVSFGERAAKPPGRKSEAAALRYTHRVNRAHNVPRLVLCGSSGLQQRSRRDAHRLHFESKPFPPPGRTF